MGRAFNTSNVGVGIASHLQLKLGIALGPVCPNALGHCCGRVLRDRAIEREIFAVASTEKSRHRLATCPTKNVPARHVESGLNVRMPAHGLVHTLIDRAKLRWVTPQQMWSQLGDPSAR